jgi:hypothetical protein
MQEFIIGWAINTILTFVKMLVREPHKKDEVRKALLKVRDAIDALYSDDENLPVSL